MGYVKLLINPQTGDHPTGSISIFFWILTFIRDYSLKPFYYCFCLNTENQQEYKS